MSVTSRYPRPRRPRGARRGWLDRHGRLGYGLAGVIGFIVLWEVGSRNGWINEFFFSRPTAIVAAGAAEVQIPRFWEDVRLSTTEFLVGYGLAIVIGIPLGLLTGWYRRLQFILDPWLNFLNSLPRFALLPVIVIATGLGIWSKIVVCFLGAVLAIIIPTIQGVRTVDRRYLDVASSFGASQPRRFITVVAPATVPFIVTGLRLGIARALIGVVTGELFAATGGLGFFIKKASDTLQTDKLLFGVLIFTFAGIILVEVLRRLETRVQRWRPARRGAAA
ncbi:MAG TPA: ABC transporter permease [Candidatus Limnocylindrales bacterium]|nr:ABC transporter permease [Candidatus Limnocylindrales bacterium]